MAALFHQGKKAFSPYRHRDPAARAASAVPEAPLARRAPTASPGCGGRSLPSGGPIFRVGGKSPDGEFHIAASNAGLPS